MYASLSYLLITSLLLDIFLTSEAIHRNTAPEAKKNMNDPISQAINSFLRGIHCRISPFAPVGATRA
jgi:hypothetical protein